MTTLDGKLGDTKTTKKDVKIVKWLKMALRFKTNFKTSSDQFYVFLELLCFGKDISYKMLHFGSSSIKSTNVGGRWSKH
jgi:hypothetical protein